MKISLLLQTGSQKTRDKKRMNQKMPTTQGQKVG